MGTKRQRTVVVNFEEASNDPKILAAMNKELQSFNDMKCVEEVLLGSLPGGANGASTKS